MKTDVIEDLKDENITKIRDELDHAKTLIENSFSLSFEAINKDPLNEKYLIDLWSKYFQNLNYSFLRESEKTNNQKLYKNVIKYIMFKS